MQLLTEAHYMQMGLQPLITAKAEREGGIQIALFNILQGGTNVF